MVSRYHNGQRVAVVIRGGEPELGTVLRVDEHEVSVRPDSYAGAGLPEGAAVVKAIGRDGVAEGVNEYIAHLETPRPPAPGPIPMRLTCPACNTLHIDEGEFATKPHHTHACQSCGNVWRPAIVPTVGVRFLPGFQNTDRAGR
jgi:hypothetical protein